ncbi:unnamed protein product, partial [Brassica rapa subsp. narinosa]
FRVEILDGDIEKFWVINTRQKHSWLVNKLLDAREIIYPWIRQRVQNGETTYFWSTNWSPYGKLTDYLHTPGAMRESSLSVGIRSSSTTWLMVLNRCPTRDRMLQRGLQTDSHCLLCNSYPES